MLLIIRAHAGEADARAPRLSGGEPWSTHTGVSWHNRDGKWVAELMHLGKKHYLGQVRFCSENDDFPLKNDDFPLKNDDFPLKNDDFPLKKVDFPLKNDDFPLKNDDFIIKFSTMTRTTQRERTCLMLSALYIHAGD